MGELATIKIDLLPDGRVRISSVCMDRPDSSYAPLAEERAPAEVEKLLGELRVRLQSDVAAASRRGLAPESVFAALGAERAADPKALAMMAAHWFEAAGFHIAFTFLPSD